VKQPVLISEQDFQSHAEPSGRSRMDVLLETKWIAAQSLGVFKYNVSEGSLPMRTTSGRFSFVVQLNPDRGTQRRRPQETCQLLMSFDETLFNFTKTKESETLLRLQLPASLNVCEASLLVNNSPIEYCSSLLVPDPSLKLPQVLTSDSLLHAVSFLAAG
jgi:GDP-D-glucose phosphorylase